MTTTTKTAIPPVTKCFHVNPMSKGGLGKSVEAEFRASWMLARGIEWRGSDLDQRHQTFSGRHPTRVKMFPSEAPEEAKEAFMEIFRAILRDPFPLHLVDCRAQADKLFTDAVEEFNFDSLCKAHGIRMTLFLFPSDELETMINLRDLVKFGAKRVDFVIVENRARNECRLYKDSPFEKTLMALGARTLRLPVITSPTMLAMERVESISQRGISFAEFASPETHLLDPIMVMELGVAMAKMYRQYDSIADVLLPPHLAAQVKSTSDGNISKAKTNSENIFGFNFPS